MEGKIFEAYRALGLYSTHIPHCTRYHQRQKEHYVFVAVGKVFHSYNCSKLGITQVSNAHPEDISCIAADRFLVYTGCGKTIRAFQHNRQVKYIYEGHNDDVHLLLPYSEHIISVDKSSTVKIWHIQSQELFTEMEFNNNSFEISTILHPSTYMNKVLFGSIQGKMQLWNIRKNEMLFEFSNSEDSSSIVSLVQAPAVDVVAIGRSSGNIMLHNIRVNQEIMKFRQSGGPVIGVAFRTDGPSTMVTASPQGNIAVWDLDEKRLLGMMEHAHSTAIAGMTFIHGQPLLLTNASDNSIKMWAFDQSDGKGRLLRHRDGHSAPPTKIKFHGDSGENILTVGLDSTMRSFSTIHEEKNKSLGQASRNRSAAKRVGIRHDDGKLSPIVDFCSKTAKEREWDNIIAFHHRYSHATTWNYQNCRMGSFKLLHERFQKNQHKKSNDRSDNSISNAHCYVTAVTMTECGNFCLIGYNTGDLDIYNIQSGIYRGSFTEGDKENNGTAHDKSITGLAVDFLNQIVVSAGLDLNLKFWKFKSRQLLDVINLPSLPAILNLQGGNSMIAVALDDFSIHVYDLDTRKLVRHYPGCQGAITDMTWSTDGRWLLSSAMDCTIKTWELPSAHLIDCFLVHAAAVSLALSPTSDLLATCHVDDLGIYLWSNRSIFTRISLKPLPIDFHPSNIVELPKTDVMDQDQEKDAEQRSDEIEIVEDESQLENGSFEPLDDSLVTLSLFPQSRWANLLSLDVIKQRNKPKEPPTLPKSAPFFLPTIAGLEPTFDISEEKIESKINKRSILNPLSDIGLALLDQKSETPFTIMNKLKELGPSAIDIEIRGLSPDGGGSVELMSAFLSFILSMLRSRRDFELVESYLGLFMKVHSEMISSDSTLLTYLREIEMEHKAAWDCLGKDIDQCVCLANYVKSSLI
uniref:WD repeat-containing protein 36-like n=1 Tax=Styela clava TaxID=7725 RepID=UPI0019396CEC|nr:WD repeat-containing protein 36-like [Styela clava]